MARTPVDLDTIETDALLQRGIASARVGDVDDARTCLAEVTRRAPDNADAWLWLAGVETQPNLKREHFERVLALRPGDPEAVAGLERLSEKYGAGVLTPDTEVQELHCTWHPDRATLLRCNRCNRPMCTECAVQHPVGLRCKECVKELRPAMYKVTTAGLVAATLVGLAIGGVAGVVLLFVGAIGWIGWILSFLWGGAVGAGMAEAVSLSAGLGQGRKRGLGLQLAGSAALILGVALALWWRAGSPDRLVASVMVYILPIVIYLFAAIGAVLARLR